MAQPIALKLPPRDSRAELQARLQNAPLEHAEALLSVYDVLQRLHDRGMLDLLRGALGSSDRVLEILVEAAKTPQSAGTMYWGGVYGHNWFVDPAKQLTVIVFTNTAPAGMAGEFPDSLRDAVYAAAD